MPFDRRSGRKPVRAVRSPGLAGRLMLLVLATASGAVIPPRGLAVLLETLSCMCQATDEALISRRPRRAASTTRR